MLETYVCWLLLFLIWGPMNKVTMKLFGWKFDSDPQAQEDYDNEQARRIEASQKLMQSQINPPKMKE